MADQKIASLTDQVAKFVSAQLESNARLESRISDLSAEVPTIATEMKNNSDAQERANTDFKKKTKNAIEAMANNVPGDNSGATAVRAELLRPGKPLTLGVTKMAVGHNDWLARTLASIKFWNPPAAKILLGKLISFDMDDDSESYGHFWMHPNDFNTNQALFNMLQAAVPGKARSHLLTAIRTACADDDLEPDKELVHDDDTDYDNHPYQNMTNNEKMPAQEDHDQMRNSAFLAWQAPDQTDEASIDKTLPRLPNTKCDDLRRVPAHLNTMDNLYDQYRRSVGEERLDLEQQMLPDYLIESLPDAFILSIRARFMGKSRKKRVWDRTMSIARDVLETQMQIAKRRAERAKTQPTKRTHRSDDKARGRDRDRRPARMWRPLPLAKACSRLPAQPVQPKTPQRRPTRRHLSRQRRQH